MSDYRPLAETLDAIREAARVSAPAVVSWAPGALDALRWPALAPFVYETPEQAQRREFHEQLMQECVRATLLLTPHSHVGNVVSAGGESKPTIGTVSGPSPAPPALAT